MHTRNYLLAIRKAAKEDSNKQNKGGSHADRATVSCRDLIPILKPGAQNCSSQAYCAKSDQS